MAYPSHSRPPRVAFVAATLGMGGAEKQLAYMVGELHRRGVDARVFSLVSTGPNLAKIVNAGVPVIPFADSTSRLVRLARLLRELKAFAPDVIQSSHFFTNFYAGVVGRVLGFPVLGALRGDGAADVADCGWLGSWGLRLPHVLVANSQAALTYVVARLGKRKRAVLVPNVIDLAAFDAPAVSAPPVAPAGRALVFGVGRLVAVKRFDLFLSALAQARGLAPSLTGVLVGDGPERTRLQARAAALGLLPDGCVFVGSRDDVPGLLRQGVGFLLTSSSEGFPNVILEAMAASLPVVTTPAGDAALVVRDGVTGYVVPHGAVAAMAHRLVEWVRHPALAAAQGIAGRNRVLEFYSATTLADRLLSLYATLGKSNARELVLASNPSLSL